MSEGVVIRGRLAGVMLAVALVLPAAAAAQSQAGPFAGLFGRTPPRTGQEVTRVEARTGLSGLYDGVGPGRPSASHPSVPNGGAIAGVNAGINFESRRDRLQLRGRTSASHQQFLQTPTLATSVYDAGVTVTAKVATRFTIDAGASATRSPFFQLAFATPTPGDTLTVAVPGDFLTAPLMANDAFEGMLGFTNQFSKRSSVSASVSRRATLFRDQPENDYNVFGARGELRHRVSRGATLRLGYGREQSRQNSLGPDRFVHEVIDAGIDLDRALAIGRRTTFSFYSQNSMLRESGGPRRYRLNGGISLRRQIGRSWSVALAANRNTDFEPGFLAPLFSDALSLTIGGLLSPRLEWTAGLGARRGHVGFDTGESFSNYSGVTRLSIGLTRKTGLFAQYGYYDYEVSPASTIVGLLPALSRQQVSVGLSIWLPIYSHVREPRDPR